MPVGRMKELEIDFANLEVSFIEFGEALLKKQGYIITHAESHPGPGLVRGRPDLVAADPKTRGAVLVEVKIWRSPRIERPVLRNAIAALAANVRAAKAEKGILIVPVPLDPVPAGLSANGVPIEVWDLRKLSNLASGDVELTNSLADFLREAEISARDLPPDMISFMDVNWQGSSTGGRTLANSLQSSTAGVDSAKEFERLCEEAVKLLFGEEFRGWSRQASVEGGFHRLDLIARLVPRHIFWRDLATDFHTRYVVFEFKNYTGPIGQDQIFTTEKYLFPTALRSIAINIARNGADDGAREAAKGGLRESGKLILIISLDDLVAMLEGFDAGDDPHNLLFQCLDGMLTDLGR
jgi:hypothetical protein